MKQWYRVISIAAILLLLTANTSAQYSASTDDEFESTIDRSTDDFEEMVDRIVDGVENEVDRLLDSRRQYRYDDVKEEEQDKTKSSMDAVTFNGNTEIALNDSVQSDLVVKNGNLTIFGTVFGDVLVVNGDIDLRSSARVLGNVRAMNGKISKESGSFVEGYTEQTASSTSKKNSRRNTYRTRYTYSFKPYFWTTENIVDDNFLFRYNRVEGLFIGFGSEKKFYWDGSKAVSGFGSFGYGFTSHKWRLQLGLDRQFAYSDDVLYEVGGEIHSLTDSKDEWIMNLSENNLSSILFREDFRDYYQREGFSVHSARYSKDGDLTTMIDLRFTNDLYESMVQAATWAVFGGSTFRHNPTVNTGTMKSLSVSAGVSTVEKYRYHSEGWNFYVKGEYGGNELGGDFDFSQAMIDIRRFQPVSDDDQINVRLRIGSLEGAPIQQRIFEIGGANTLPAFGFKEFSGNRMLLANVEYRLSGDIIDEIFFWPNSFNLIAFGDAGAAATVNSKWGVYEGFNAFTSSKVKSDYGFAVAWHDGDARLGFAWRTDKQAPVSIFFRLNRAF